MMPLNNYNNLKIKIFSTRKGIKIIDSPIKIQILNMLENESSEADIVKNTGKSKSTISVHLKNLLEDGIISYKSHPIDRRSKIFYIYAQYIGEIYPDSIIYQMPKVNGEIETSEQLYKEELKIFKSILLRHGLQLSPLSMMAGEQIGQEIYKSYHYESLDELLDLIKDTFDKLNMGKIKVSSQSPLIIKNKECSECLGQKMNIPICDVTRGILKGILESHFGKKLTIEEAECMSKNDDSCTFMID